MVCGSNSIRRKQCTTNQPISRAKIHIFTYNPTVTASHVKIGLLALCLALLIALPTSWLSRHAAPIAPSTTIALEHDQPVTLHVTRMASSGTNVIEVGFTGSGKVALHVPSSWKRMEVRGAPIDRVASEPQEWSFMKWTMPAGAIVRFEAPNPGTLTLHNPSGVPVTVSTTTVNVRTGTREDEAFIVTTDPYTLP